MAEPAPLQFRIDPWATEYASALQVQDEEMDEPEVSVDATVELAVWQPLTPSGLHPARSIVFVDGVQRIEARVVVEQDGQLAYGAFASLAAGAVLCAGNGTSIETIQVRRVLALSTKVETPPVAVQCGSMDLTFHPQHSTKQGYVGVADAIDSKRRDEEMLLGQAMVGAGHPLVLVDGRLRLFPTPHSAVVGYTKTIHRRYLGAPYAQVLAQLEAGQRTPLFQIDEQRALYSWYVRLSPRRPIDHALAGLVRLETPAAVGRDQAVELADQTAAELPRFASTPERDPRAPQNLLPIGGLELALRHQLGDQAWLRRGIESYLYRMAG